MTQAEDDARRVDPRGLIRDSYEIEGISPAEARAIFLDWALGVPRDEDMQAALAALLARYGPRYPDHPMTALLREGRASGGETRGRRGRRGGTRGRR